MIISLYLKIFNLVLFVRGFFYLLFNIRIGPYKRPEKEIDIIGYLDRERLIHTSIIHRQRFNERNVFQKGDFVRYKEGIISIALFDDQMMVRKSFRGFKGKLKFYNELICLSRLIECPYTPNIHFVDYRKKLIYIDFLDGDCLVKVTETNFHYGESETNFVKGECLNALDLIHSHKMAIIDVWSHNIIYDPSIRKLYFIDFSDSVCSIAPRFVMKRLQKKDKDKLISEVINKL